MRELPCYMIRVQLQLNDEKKRTDLIKTRGFRT